MDLKAGWDGTWQDFLSTDKASFLESLVTFHRSLSWTQALDPAQHYAWETEYDVMTSTLNHVLAETQVKPGKCWIAFEQELIDCASHNHPNFRVDNDKVYGKLEEAVRGTRYAASLRPL